MPKRKVEEDEDAAEAEVAAALAAAAAAPPDEEIGGLGDGTAMVAFEIPGQKVKQYQAGRQSGEKSLILMYLCIRGLGETPRLMLAECGAAYTHLASPMGEPQAVSCEWRKRSPNGLMPMMSGLGVPRAKPISQSATICRYLAARFGMMGATELDRARADTLYETAKDLKGKTGEIVGTAEDATEGAKGPTALATCIAAMLEGARKAVPRTVQLYQVTRPQVDRRGVKSTSLSTAPRLPPPAAPTKYSTSTYPPCFAPRIAEMPDPADDSAALNYGQMELLNLLMQCDETSPGCVRKLHPSLEGFRASGVARPRIAAYLASPMRFPTFVSPTYRYTDGPVKRSSFAQ